MIPKNQLEKIAQNIRNRIDKAILYLDGEAIEGVIKKITLHENVIKVFISLSGEVGTIEKVEIYDTDNELLQEQYMQVEKNEHYKFLEVVEIRVESETIYG